MSTANEQSIEARKKYVEAWNDLMIDIWRERIFDLGVYDDSERRKGDNHPHLFSSVAKVDCIYDEQAMEVKISQIFLEYGLWQDYGVGRETPRKGRPDEAKYRNTDGTLKSFALRPDRHGQLKQDKVRETRPWFSRKYYKSVMRLNEFYAESVGKDFIGILSDIFDDKSLRRRYGKTY